MKGGHENPVSFCFPLALLLIWFISISLQGFSLSGEGLLVKIGKVACNLATCEQNMLQETESECISKGTTV